MVLARREVAVITATSLRATAAVSRASIYRQIAQ
jgi:hypothetical protein